MQSLLAVIASACLVTVTGPATAQDSPKRDGMSKEAMAKHHDDMVKKCADRTGLSKDDVGRCDAMMKHHGMKHDGMKHDAMKKDDEAKK